jgi:type VI secretion system protein ImpK
MSTPPDDPFRPNNATILRPRPGRRAGGAPPPGAPPPGAPLGSQQPPNYGAGPGSPVSEFVSGPNPILRSALPLLVLSARLRGQIANADAESLRQQCIQEMRAFDERVRKAGASPDDVIAARYALCTAIDEAVLATPWGAQSTWPRESLLVTFHKERDGGKKFFEILDQLSLDPVRHRDALELFYVCLALGFEGRYALEQRGGARLGEIRQDLYRRLEPLRGGIEPELSPQWKGVEDRRNVVLRLVPLWVIAAACLVLLVGGYIFLNSQLNSRAAELNATLANVGLDRVEAAAPRADAQPSGLARFLAPQIAQGVVQVREQGSRTVIILTVPDLFASGSTRVNARYDDLVHQIGAALNTVPGRLLVMGHTDDQPVHSFQFSDNYALSRARASYVAQLLSHDVTDAGRIDSAGKGDSDPLYKPPNLPDNRARNRRVEIINDRTG